MNRSYTGFWPKTAFFDYMKASAGGYLVFLVKNQLFKTFGWRVFGFPGGKSTFQGLRLAGIWFFWLKINFSRPSAGGYLVFQVENQLFKAFDWRVLGFGEKSTFQGLRLAGIWFFW